MARDRQLVIRVETAMADRIEAYAAKLREEYGVSVSFAEAARKLLAEGLAAVEKPRTKRGG